MLRVSVSMICMTAAIITIIITLTSIPVSASSSSSPSISSSSASSNAAESSSNENVKSMSQLSRLQVAVQLQMQIEQLEKTQTEQLKTPVDAESKTLTDSSEERKENVTPSNDAPSVALDGLPIDSTVSPSSLTITSPSSFPSRLILTYWHPISSSWDWLFYSSLDEYSNGFWIDRTDYCGEALLNNNALFIRKLNEEKREKLEEDQEEENEVEKMEWNIAELYEPSVDGKEKCVVILPQTENGKSYVLYLISWMTKSWSAWSTPIVFAG